MDELGWLARNKLGEEEKNWRALCAEQEFKYFLKSYGKFLENILADIYMIKFLYLKKNSYIWEEKSFWP